MHIRRKIFFHYHWIPLLSLSEFRFLGCWLRMIDSSSVAYGLRLYLLKRFRGLFHAKAVLTLHVSRFTFLVLFLLFYFTSAYNLEASSQVVVRRRSVWPDQLSIIDRFSLNVGRATTFACFGYFPSHVEPAIVSWAADRPPATRVEIQCGGGRCRSRSDVKLGDLRATSW